MSNGLGYAVGEGAEAFKSALYPTLHYKIAMAQQQMEAGMQAEKLRMDQESAAFENEKTRLATEQAKFTLEKSKYNLEQTKEIQKLREEYADVTTKPLTSQVKAVKSGKRAGVPHVKARRLRKRLDIMEGRLPTDEVPKLGQPKIFGGGTTGIYKYTPEGELETLLAPPPKEIEDETEKQTKELEKAQTRWDKDVRNHILRNADLYPQTADLITETGRFSIGYELKPEGWSNKDWNRYKFEQVRIRRFMGSRPETPTSVPADLQEFFE